MILASRLIVGFQYTWPIKQGCFICIQKSHVMGCQSFDWLRRPESEQKDVPKETIQNAYFYSAMRLRACLYGEELSQKGGLPSIPSHQRR